MSNYARILWVLWRLERDVFRLVPAIVKLILVGIINAVLGVIVASLTKKKCGQN